MDLYAKQPDVLLRRICANRTDCGGLWASNASSPRGLRLCKVGTLKPGGSGSAVLWVAPPAGATVGCAVCSRSFAGTCKNGALAAARSAPSPSPYFVPGLPHVMLIELGQALISYQDYRMLCSSS